MRALFFATVLLAAAHPASAQTEAEGADLRDVLAAYEDQTITTDGALQLLAVTIQFPDRLRAIGADPESIRRGLLRSLYWHPGVDRPRTAFALAIESYRDGDDVRGDSLFARAIANASSDRERANFYYARGVGPYGPDFESDLEAALRVDPLHGPALYRRAGLIANSVGRPSSLRGRFAYWCLADIYRRVASTTDDGRIGGVARRAADRYDRAAPNPDDFADLGVQPGDPVDASLGAYGRCATTVR